MSSDIFIELRYVLSRPNVFDLYADINGSTKSALESYANTEFGETPDFEYIRSELEPLLLCRISAIPNRSYVVDISDERSVATNEISQLDLHFCVTGESRRLLMRWLELHAVPHEFI